MQSLNNLINPFLYINDAYYIKNMDNSIYDLTIYKDQLFIPDFRNNKLIIFGLPEGNVLETFNVPMPHGISVDPNGTIYLCTYKNNSINVIENNISKYKKSAQFDNPVSIAVKNNYIIIANWGKGDTGNLIFSNDGLNSFEKFTDKWVESKPHAVRINSQHEIVVVYRNPPGIVVYDINGNILKQRIFSDEFDPLSIVEWESHFLVPNCTDGKIYIFQNSLSDLHHFDGGGHGPTNLAIWNNLLFICEEKANRVLNLNLNKIDNLLNGL